MKQILILSLVFLYLLKQSHAQSAFFTSDAPGCVNDTIHFTPAPPGGTVLQEVWEFGDGTFVTYLPPTPFPVFATHVYTTPAIFAVSRTVKFTSGSESFSLLVQVIPRPLANFSWPGATCVGTPVQFTDLSQNFSGGTLVSWNWNFGDPASGINNVSTLQNPSHSYAAGGPYNVALTVANNDGCTHTIIKTMTVQDLPVANFSSTGACLGSPTQFTDLSVANAAAIVSHAWSFGDGGTSSQASPVHFYASYGIYNATLTVVNSNGCTNIVTNAVVVNPKPVADFSFPATNCTGSTVPFMDMSYIPAGFSSSILQWAWEFGDGSPAIVINSPANPNILHTFAGSANAYMVRLTVTTNYNCSAFTEKIINISPLPVAAFVHSGPTCELQPVQFTDISQTGGGGAIQSWNWNFGDPASGTGNNAATQNPSHSFTHPGTFAISLVIVNSNGCSDTITNVLPVNLRPFAYFTADTVLQGSPTSFTDFSSSGQGPISSWLWNFGDNQSSTAGNPSHLYAAPGTYLVTLTVTTVTGCANDTTKSVLVNPASTPPATRTVANLIVGSSDIKCYHASQLITVAGNGTMFIVLSGGNATFISGQKISFLPGTTVQSGGYMQGYIAVGGPYCPNPSLHAMAVDEEDSHKIFEQSPFRIYPNPTGGTFTLELQTDAGQAPATVKIYNMMGGQVAEIRIRPGGEEKISLSNQSPGIYLVRMIRNNEIWIGKVIRQ
jgi:PKD repeat protein